MLLKQKQSQQKPTNEPGASEDFKRKKWQKKLNIKTCWLKRNVILFYSHVYKWFNCITNTY
jgi:hypothetical protein